MKTESVAQELETKIEMAESCHMGMKATSIEMNINKAPSCYILENTTQIIILATSCSRIWEPSIVQVGRKLKLMHIA
eukprot:888805-Heterocapsa_arctica.AAC.1